MKQINFSLALGSRSCRNIQSVGTASFNSKPNNSQLNFSSCFGDSLNIDLCVGEFNTFISSRALLAIAFIVQSCRSSDSTTFSDVALYDFLLRDVTIGLRFGVIRWFLTRPSLPLIFTYKIMISIDFYTCIATHSYFWSIGSCGYC